MAVAASVDDRAAAEPPASLTGRRLSLIGRRMEMSALEEFLREALDGRPRLVLLSGEAGSGKTRLIEELRSFTALNEVLIGRGSCDEQVSFPYRPLVAALSSLLASAEELPEELLGNDVAAVRQLLHPSSAPRPGRQPGLHFSAGRERGELFASVARALRRLGRARPTALFLEDLHAADQGTLDLLSHLAQGLVGDGARDTGGVSCLLVASLRPPAPDSRLALAIDRIRRSSITRVLELRGLDEIATGRLLANCGVAHPSRDVVASVQALSGGNPLFVRELARALRRRSSRGGIPPTISTAVGATLSGLSEDVREVLTLAAFIGERFSQLALSVALSLPERELRSLLDEAIDAEVIRQEGRAYRFDHPTIPHVLRARTPAEERRRIHAAIADVLERLYATQPGEHALEISHHLIQAGDEVDPNDLVRVARMAGEQAFAVCAWGEAARHLSAASNAAGRLPDAEQGRLHVLAGLAYNHDLDARRCVEHYRSAIRHFEAAGEKRGVVRAQMYLLRAHLTIAATAYGAEPEIEALKAAVHSLGREEPILRGLAIETISEAHWLAGRSQEAIHAGSQALVIGRNEQDDPLCHAACLGLALGHFQALRVHEALGYWRDALAYAERARDPWLQTVPPPRIALAELMLGELGAAKEHAVDAFARAQRAQCLEETSMALGQQASVALARGELGLAEGLAEEAIALAERTGYAWAAVVAVPVLAAGAGLRGRFEDGEAALALLLERGRIFTEPGPRMQLIADCYRAWLRVHSARSPGMSQRALERLVESAAAAGGDPVFLAPICALIETCVQAGFPRLVAELVKPLGLARERGIAFTPGWAFLIPRVLGVAAAGEKRLDEARSYFDEATAIAERADATLELGLALVAHAAVLRETGESASASRAAERGSAILAAIGIPDRSQPDSR
jgi:tetratricopeptide (TPR) repeat protein